MDIQKLLSDIDAGLQQISKDAIDKIVTEKLQSIIIDEKNLSPNLITMIMSKESKIKIPIQEEVETPPALDYREEISDLISASVDDIYMDLKVGNNVYLYGKAGTGKTSLAKKIADIFLGRRTQIINCNQFTSPINIIGGQTIEGYKQGSLSLAWENGDVLILDELPKLDPNTAGLLNEALAQAAEQETTRPVSKEEYMKLKSEFEEAAENGKYLGYEVKEEGGSYFKINHVTMTDGKGDKLRKSPNFCVIGTGNTTMKEAPANFSGNNRQDYSLVDRFSGSFYKIGENVALETSLTYKIVYQICSILRRYLESDESSVESVSLRTMLNFNRIYEQQGLRFIKADKYMIKPLIGADGKPKAKTLKDCVVSFLDVLPETKRKDIEAKHNLVQMSESDIDVDEFISEFKRLHNVDPYDGKPV